MRATCPGCPNPGWPWPAGWPSRPGTRPRPVPWAWPAVNALLAPPEGLEAVKGQDLILERGTGRRVAVVGHFPFVERMGERFEDLCVLELAPRGGDLPANRAKDVLPAADVVAMTGTTLLNGTMAPLLALCRPDAFVMVLGPQHPFRPRALRPGRGRRGRGGGGRPPRRRARASARACRSRPCAAPGPWSGGADDFFPFSG